MSVLFFLESVAGGEKEVYLSNLVVAVKWHLSLCVCIPLKVYICVIPKKKRRVGIWILLLFFYILWTTTKNLAQSFKGFLFFYFLNSQFTNPKFLITLSLFLYFCCISPKFLGFCLKFLTIFLLISKFANLCFICISFSDKHFLLIFYFNFF